ncbi:MAG: 30S ribosomal protein S15 [Candidatus Hadarchaeaceae archaeon]
MAARKIGLSLGRGAELSASEVEELVVKLDKEGAPASKIGLIMRDQYAVPSVKKITGKNVKEILESHGIKAELPEDLGNVIRKAVRIASHLDRNPKDFRTKRSLEIVEARVNKLATYYKRKGVLPKDWRYDRERAVLLARS